MDPANPGAGTKTLAAEILRGAGALLLTRGGRRFADELGRALQLHPEFTRNWPRL